MLAGHHRDPGTHGGRSRCDGKYKSRGKTWPHIRMRMARSGAELARSMRIRLPTAKISRATVPRSAPAGQRGICSSYSFVLYQALNLRPSPSSSTETFQLWDWDVAELFLGSDFQDIRRYKEFEISPQGSGSISTLTCPSRIIMKMAGRGTLARIDEATKIWYGAMRIPFLGFAEPPAGSRRQVSNQLVSQPGAAAGSD